MRSRKTEDIRRLLISAISMCDLSVLEGVKKSLIKTIERLNDLDSVRRSQNITLHDKPKINFQGSSALLDVLDDEIKKEQRKLSEKQQQDLISE
jgi:hypothetical protein